jgi:hypothetical protein
MDVHKRHAGNAWIVAKEKKPARNHSYNALNFKEQSP